MSTLHPTSLFQTLIERKVSTVLSPIEHFIRRQVKASTFLMAGVLLAMFIANSPWHEVMQQITNMQFGLILHTWTFELSLAKWVNEGLLALFFFFIGLEIKREMLIGRLSGQKEIRLVIVAALGGMVIPAITYAVLNIGQESLLGWAIPMATDTALAIGVLALLARHISLGATIFLAALAIFDDVITIAVIAIFYAHHIEAAILLKATIPFGLLIGANLAGIRRGWVYAIFGIVLWWYIHNSGIHGTLAGLLTAAAIPARSRIGQRSFIDKIKQQIADFELRKQSGQTMLRAQGQHQIAADIQESVREVSTPLQRWHASIEMPVAIIVLPLFALFYAGFPLTWSLVNEAMRSPVTLGIMAGLLIGKPLGIIFFSYCALRMHIATLPAGMRFQELVGIGMLAGIGLTMSLFIAQEGFEQQPHFIELAKIGILLSSLIAALLGAAWLYWARRSRPSA